MITGVNTSNTLSIQLNYFSLFMFNTPSYLSFFLSFYRYSEWYSLNQTLRKAFPLEIFPPLPKKIFLGRSQKRTVAQQRMGELQQYLQVSYYILLVNYEIKIITKNRLFKLSCF